MCGLTRGKNVNSKTVGPSVITLTILISAPLDKQFHYFVKTFFRSLMNRLISIIVRGIGVCPIFDETNRFILIIILYGIK